jgi:hypothetical protein
MMMVLAWQFLLEREGIVTAITLSLSSVREVGVGWHG